MIDPRFNQNILPSQSPTLNKPPFATADAGGANAESSTILLRAVEQTDEGIVITDRQGIIEYVNPSFERMTGYTREEVIGQTPAVIKSGQHEQSFYKELWETIIDGKSFRGEFVNRKKDGTLYYEEKTISPILDCDGNITHFVATGKDVTKRRQAMESLRESTRTLQAIVRSSPLAIIALDASRKVAGWNLAAERIFGWSEEEVLGRPNPIVPDDEPELYNKMGELADQGETMDSLPARPRKKDGSRLDVTLSIAPLRDGTGRADGTIAVITDMTERKHLEEQLRQSQKMEAVGRLAGGVAHDFNNLLTAIIGYSQLAATRLQPGDPLRPEIEEIERAGHRAAALTRQLLAFSRRQILQPLLLDLSSIVADLQKMLQRVIGEDVDLVTHLEPQLGQVLADPSQIEQIILNLAVNARDAMPSGGKLSIETTNVVLDQEYAMEHLGAKVGPHVVLAVTDTGAGIDPGIKCRIFEPFFTTKEDGKGTGLGLSTVYGIVKQSGGHIDVASAPGEGATFRIFFPLVQKEREAAARPAPRSELSGSETVLLVEDDAGVRKLARQVLESAGYTVLEVAHPGDTISICERHSGPIHLMITDVVMPQIGGRELAELLATRYPEMNVLYMSGYPDNTAGQPATLSAEVHFLP
ncbi:MAG TPA: PAS domain S-box protein, partial [Blastocatellia bacterium]|nr:PAS domain S-box protein [Blastocatellia bacterium]